MSKTTIEDLRLNIFDAMERLKSANDPNCSANEKMDVEQAKAFSGLAGRVVDTYKVQVQAMNLMAKGENMKLSSIMLEEAKDTGIFKGKQNELR